jgi:signal transduction histidine kinase
VSRDGTLKYVLTAVVHPDPLIEAVSRPHAPAEAWTQAFVDRTGTVAAGEGPAAALVGRPVAADVLARVREAPRGIYRREREHGESDYVAFSEAPFSGWTAMISLPAAQIDAPIRQSLAWLASVGLLIVGIGCAAAVVLGRAVAAALKSASAAAHALVRAERPPARPSSVAEVASLGEALQEAATLLKRRGEEREELLRQAEAAVRLRDAFLARASHELRTPLTVVKGHLRLLARQLADGQAAGLVAVADKHVDRVTQLVAHLLDASRLAAGQLPVEPEPTELAAVVAEAVAQVRPLAQDKAVRLETAVPTGLRLVGDRLQLEQAVLNLLTNAVKHTAAGGTIRAEGAGQGAQVELRVRDSGEGIAPEYLERVFEPFFQAGSAVGRRKAAGAGAGLGLALVRGIVELHGGRVWAESEGPGKGSTFVVRLPLSSTTDRAA